MTPFEANGDEARRMYAATWNLSEKERWEVTAAHVLRENERRIDRAMLPWRIACLCMSAVAIVAAVVRGCS